MMPRRTRTVLAMAAASGCCPAMAQEAMVDEAVRFTLKPRPALAIVHTRTPTGERLDRLRAVPVDDRAHDIDMVIRRHRQRMMAERLVEGSMAGGFAFNPRSRVILLSVEDRLPVGEQGWARVGFQGMKLSNRGATITATGTDDRLRTRDWFQPHAMVGVTPAPDVSLRLGYAERSYGFGETGLVGPMAGSREEFRAFARSQRPEKRRRVRIDADWQVTPALDMSLRLFDGQIAHRMLFDGGSDRPVDAGSAQVRGAQMTIGHRISSRLRWTMHYSEAQVASRRERQIAVEGEWRDGPWRATMRGSAGSAPALRVADAPSSRSTRVEAEMRYLLTATMRAPVAISLRLTDPDLLAGSALLRDDPVGAARAADQARGVMLGVAMGW
ncbi:MAG: hypothetical protein I8H96_10175 [Sphingomonadaceae bacterium]|nr:hypothetical protein [Sphingomonadaceae bacterium]